MKNPAFLILCFLYIANCSAQDTVERKNRLSDSVLERFFVLKSNPDIRQGAYKALFKRKIIVAFGNYANNKKTGTWNFYKQDGKLIQTFDYDKNDLTFEAAADTDEDVRYIIDKKLAIGDNVTRPVRVGGVYYGLIPYLNMFQLPFDTFGVNTESFRATLELLISPLGRLADYKIHLISRMYDYDQTIRLDVHLFSEADQTFIPATLNGEPVVSRIVIRCFVADDGRLDFY